MLNILVAAAVSCFFFFFCGGFFFLGACKYSLPVRAKMLLIFFLTSRNLAVGLD